jgi:pimeloyl-ACP methyl ester carboxylesterase
VLHRGDGPPRLVAVPGLGLSVDGWRAPVTLLAPPASAAVVALPAYGLPARSGTALDPGSSAERLVARLDELAADPVVLFGHSSSAQVVCEVARRRPERVDGLVLVGPTTDSRSRTWPRLAARWLRTAAHEPLGQVPLLARDYAHSGLVTFALAMDASRRHPSASPLGGIACPVLLVRGYRDHLSPADWLDRLAADRPGTRVVTLPVGGHMVPITHPHELVDAVVPFLRGLGLGV